MRVGGTREFNGTLTAPGYGETRVVVVTLGHGMRIETSEGDAREGKTIYPQRVTDGSWYIEVANGNRDERNMIAAWFLNYARNASVTYRTATLQPMTVRVPSENFVKIGYPTKGATFGDSHGNNNWNLLIQFVAASNPSNQQSVASKFYVPDRSLSKGRLFYPGGSQAGNFVPRPERGVYGD